MNDYVHAKCNNCDYNYIIYGEDLDTTCEMCENDSIQFIHFEDITDADVILNMIECELENANYHSMMDLPYALYNELKVCENDEVLARKIAKVLCKWI